MARVFTEDFEGGTVGGPLLGNTAFNVEPDGTFVSSPVAVGSRAAQLTTPSTAAIRVFNLDLGGLQSLRYSTVYYYLTAYPAANLYLGGVNNEGVARANWRINPAGTVTLRNNVSAVWTSTGTVPLNQWVRYEWRLDVAASQQQMRVYSLHSTTPLFDSGNQTFNTGTFNAWQVGITAAIANTTVGIDWAALDDATWVGPGAAAPSAPNSSFTAVPTSGDAPLQVAFTDTSTGTPTGWSWAFGDGAGSSVRNPTHTYTTPGQYTATLTASNDGGANPTPATATIDVTTAPTGAQGLRGVMNIGGTYRLLNAGVRNVDGDYV